MPVATTEERVVLTVETRDEITAPLQNITKKVEQANDRVAKSAQNQANTVQRAMAQVSGSQATAMGATDRMARAYDQALGRMGNSSGRVGDVINSRLGGTVDKVMRNVAASITRATPSIIAGAERIGSGIGSALAGAVNTSITVGDKIGAGLSSGLGTAGKTLGVAGAVVGGVVGKAISGGINRQLNIEDARAKLSGLGTDAATVNSIMDSALAAVQGTAFGLDSAATAAASAVASGIQPGKDLTRTLKLVGDAATIAGTDYGEMGAIFNKISASGVIQGEELAQLGDRGIPILQLLGKEMGVTAAEVKDLASKGKVDFATFQNAMEKGMGGAALKSGETTRGSMANMGAALSRVGATLTSGFFPLTVGGFNEITKTLDGVNKAIKPAATAFGTYFAGKAAPIISTFSEKALRAFGEVTGGFTALQAAYKSADDGVTSSGLPGFMERLGIAAGKVRDAVAVMNPNLDNLKALVAPLAGMFLAMGSGLLGNLPIIGRFLPVLNPFLGILLGLIAASPELRRSLGDAFNAIVPALGSVVAAFAPLVPILAEVVAWGVDLVVKVIDKLVPLFPVLVPLVVAFVAIAKIAGPVMAAWRTAVVLFTAAQVGFQAAMGVSTVLTQAQTAATERGTAGFIAMKVAQYGAVAAMAVATAAQWLFNAAVSANPISLIIIAIAALVAGVIWAYNNIGWFKDGVDAAMKWIGEAFQNVVNWWNSDFMPALSAVGQWFVDVWTNVSTFLTDTFTNIGNWFRDFIGFFVDGWGMLVDFWNGILLPAIQAVGDFFAPILDWITRLIWNATTIAVALFYKLVDFWNGVLQPALQAVGDWFNSIFTWIYETIIRPVVDGIVGLFRTLVDWWNLTLMPALQAVGQWFSDIFSWIYNTIILPYITFWIDAFRMVVDWWNLTFLPALQAVGQWFSDVLNWIYNVIIKPVVDLIVGAFTALTDWWNNTLSPMITTVGGWFRDGIGKAIEGVSGFIDGLIKGFQGFISFWSDKLKPVADAIAEIFKGIGDAIGNALGKMGEFVNNPLGGIQDMLGINKDGNGQGVMPNNSGGGVYLKGGGVLGYAGGGTVLPGFAPGKDTIPAMLSRGESVLVPELTSALGPRNIMAANREASGGRPAGSGPTASLVGALGGGGGTQVIVADGAVQVNVEVKGGDTEAAQNVADAVREAVEEVFEEIKRRGY
ncbi:tape measure protein [Arthrobacter phage Chocolat]|uniref:Tape measure protein n=8 Tax=Klausavirus princesstrina TaxID=1984784 RepID=A0A1B1SGA0_9CAUD|nr:tail length tape measure protein [Arthrobacter phage PrincessTrina]ANU79625.1 tape measure protein [Arthrobacter phage Conboy]AOZ64575.1 tape measure protein [Arthrobacter phage Chubster]AOZ64687.1 tape measure protein [Arthrobacter phage Chocolat]APC44706.1 tape measure protein [Arthrobacter phage EdgarPoe]APC44817.1 tape measure protein [Arthrobacter phage HumptyDumpty]ASX98807.1 tape measure protein [Arthrobacter phage Kabreeze]ASX99030.1 tape measure protein [Arthrobacter phage Scavit